MRAVGRAGLQGDSVLVGVTCLCELHAIEMRCQQSAALNG